MCASDNFSSAQSAYRRHYSTETALLHTLDSIYHLSEQGRPSLFVSLDLSTAFDTIDHHLLLDWLNENFGVSGTAHSWLTSYGSWNTYEKKKKKPVTRLSGCIYIYPTFIWVYISGCIYIYPTFIWVYIHLSGCVYIYLGVYTFIRHLSGCIYLGVYTFIRQAWRVQKVTSWHHKSCSTEFSWCSLGTGIFF